MRIIIKEKIVFILLCCCTMAIGLQANSQALLPYQPEQDACNAITLCSNTFYTPFSYRGGGRIYPEIDTYLRLGEDYERNSVWFRIKVATAGSIVFTIAPVDPTEDYDFSVFDATLLECPYSRMDLADAIIRYNLNCNGNCNGGLPLYPEGKIGLNHTSQLQVVPGGTVGDPFLQSIAAQAGDEYLIMVNNFSASAAGFSISLDGSTATVQNDVLVIDSVSAVCSASANYSTLKVIFNEPILCSSVAADGSDFVLGPNAPAIIAATGTNCSGRPGAYVRELTLNLNGSLKLGETYNLRLKKGGDGTTVAGLCHGSDMQEGYAKDFTIRLPYTVDAGRDTTTCVGSSIALNANPQGVGDVRIRWQPATYLSSNTIANPIASPLQDMEYVVTAAPIGFPAVCHHRDTIRVKALKGFDITTPDTMLCKPSAVPIRLAGDSAFTYSWSPANYLSGTNGMAQTATPSQSITYTITARYPGCKDSTQTINIGLRQWPILINSDTAVCQGQPVPLWVNGGNGFTHIWQPALHLNDATLNSPIATPDTTTRYIFTAKYAGCSDSVQSVLVTVDPVPKASFTIPANICVNQTVQLQASVIPQWYNGYKYQWQPSISFANANSKNTTFKALGDTEVSLIVSTANGCADTVAQALKISLPPAINAGPDLVTIRGNGVQIQAVSDSSAVLLRWSPAAYLTNASTLNPVASPPLNQLFVLQATSAAGCVATDSMLVKVLEKIEIPNAFSPNSDGINDVWNIPGLANYQNAKTQVFNRWGQVVFESTGYAKPWDGQLQGKPLPIGVYYYIINMQWEDFQPFTGSVTLLR